MVKKIPTNKHAVALNKQGYKVVVGIDEVGRGCLAGPVVAAAVILPPRTRIYGVTDSKLLAPAMRRMLAIDIKRRALAVGVGWTGSKLIDAMGLTWALRRAAELALADLGMAYEAVLLDGHHNYLGSKYFVKTVVKGDRLSQSIAAASIIAKVARDNYMSAQHQLYPQYGFNQHVGYGTPRHLAALELGLSPLHRRRFAPVRTMLAAGLTEGSSRSDLLAGSLIGGISVN
jgi:ribonuclease HII